jgi:VWFA-related protein
MKGLGRLIVLTSALGVTSVGAQDKPQTQVPFRTSTAGVAIHVSVKSGGAAVTGLHLRDFVLSDSGVRQTIQAISLERVPLDVTLVVDQHDVSQIIEKGYRREIGDVLKALAPTDRLRLIAAAGDVWELQPLSESRPIKEVVPPKKTGALSVFDALTVALLQPTELGRQQVVIVMSYGVDVLSVVSRDIITKIAERSTAQIHVLMRDGGNTYLGGRGLTQSTSQSPTDARELLVDIAKTSGGSRIWDAVFGRTIAPPVQRILNDLRAGYMLYFTPTGVPDTGWHPIQVLVRRPGKFDIKSRAGYAN